MGPSEDGADCGAFCGRNCPDACVSATNFGSSRGRIDIVFIPSREYIDVTGARLGVDADFEGTRYALPAQWREDMVRAIQESYFQNPEIRAARSKFNFWYVRRFAPFTPVSSCENICDRTAPEGWDTDCPDGIVAAIIHRGCCRDFSDGGVFSAEDHSVGTFLHESGHAVFGLADEYNDEPDCLTSYRIVDPFPNIFMNESTCEDTSSDPDSCRRFTTCKGGRWKGQPPVTMMSCECRAYPNAVCDWGPDALPRVNYVLDQYNPGPASLWGKVVVARFRYTGTAVRMRTILIVYGGAPERVIEWDGLEMDVKNATGQSLYSFTVQDPRYRDFDYPPGAEWVSEADFSVVFPFTNGMTTLVVRDVATGALLGTFDLVGAITEFCAEHPDDPQCSSMPACVGDCNGDGNVDVSELIRGVNIALGDAPLSACPSFDGDASGNVGVHELVQAVNNALGGCR